MAHKTAQGRPWTQSRRVRQSYQRRASPRHAGRELPPAVPATLRASRFRSITNKLVGLAMHRDRTIHPKCLNQTKKVAKPTWDLRWTVREPLTSASIISRIAASPRSSSSPAPGPLNLATPEPPRAVLSFTVAMYLGCSGASLVYILVAPTTVDPKGPLSPIHPCCNVLTSDCLGFRV